MELTCWVGSREVGLGCLCKMGLVSRVEWGITGGGRACTYNQCLDPARAVDVNASILSVLYLCRKGGIIEILDIDMLVSFLSCICICLGGVIEILSTIRDIHTVHVLSPLVRIHRLGNPKIDPS